jgi:ATP-dependent helicase/nuclease subunit A
MKRVLLSPYFAGKLSSMLEIMLVCRTNGKLIVESEAANDTLEAQADLTPCATNSFEQQTQDTVSEDELTQRFIYEYAHPELLSIPEKLSVSRLYPEILDGSQDSAINLEDFNKSEQNDKSERTPYLPRFAALSPANESAKRGIATHTVLQFCDFARLGELGAEAELKRLVDEKFISEKDSERVRLEEIDSFIKTPLFAEINSAKRLYRELRFNLNLPASEFTADKEKAKLLSDRKLLVQGVIDCVIEKNDGSLVLIDYKTDRIKHDERKQPEKARKRLADAHRLQLSYYKKAVTQMFGKAPERVGIYSLHLGEEIDVFT